MKNVKVLLYTLTGLMIGFGIGLLTAPVAGRDIRYNLKNSVNRLKGGLGIEGEEEFSESEMEMDATNGKRYGL